jgi:Protein of unknown function (DUF3574)
MRTLVLVFLFIFCGSGAVQPSTLNQAPTIASRSQPGCMSLGISYTRTTLYFGLSRPAGKVSDRRWRAFLREQVTPRFPNGLTVWNASGQWKRKDGHIVREPAKVLLLVHKESPAADAGIRAIITAYKQSFQQESVLWETAQVCAAF